MLFAFSRLLLLVIALSIDAFTAGFAYGADKVRIPPLSTLMIALVCDAVFIVSLSLGGLLQTVIPPLYTRIFSFMVLFLLGFVKLFDSAIKRLIQKERFSNRELHFTLKNLRFILTVYAVPEKANSDEQENLLSPREAFSLGLALSLDSAAAGLGAAAERFPIAAAALLTLFVGMAAVRSGCYLGKQVAARTSLQLSWLSGTLLLFLSFTRLF